MQSASHSDVLQNVSPSRLQNPVENIFSFCEANRVSCCGINANCSLWFSFKNGGGGGGVNF